MFSFIYMKILESQPRRYDRGISWMTFGTADRSRERIADWVAKAGRRILDMGTGTGTLALMEAVRGAEVIGVDPSAAMLEVAEKKRGEYPGGERARFLEAGVAELDSALAGEHFDAVSASLLFSELSEDEQCYALRQAFNFLWPGGLLAIMDEMRPVDPWKRLLYQLCRLPLALLTFALTQTSTRPVSGLESKVREAGFVIEKVEMRNLDSLLLLYATKPEGP